MNEPETLEQFRHREHVLREAIAAARCVLWEARVVEQPDGSFAWKLNILSPESTRREFGFEHSNEDNDNKTYVQRIPPDQMKRMNEVSFKALSNKAEGYHQEFCIRAADGGLRHMSEYVRIINIEPGSFHLVGVQVDVTDRMRAEVALKKSQEQLRHAHKLEAVGQFAVGVANYFNNLMTVVKGYSKLALKRLDEKDPLRKEIEMIEKVSERADDLNQQLLAFGRMGSLEVRVLDLNSLVHAMHRMLRPLIHDDIEFLTLLDPELGKVKADPAQIQQALINLAVNSRQAMPYGGKLIFETRNVEISEEFAAEHQMMPGPHVLLAVSDTGCGMSNEVQSRVFKPFFTTKGPAKGTGLGLAAVQAIVKQAGGEVYVSSELNMGTRFKIYLPRVTDEDAALKPQE